MPKKNSRKQSASKKMKTTASKNSIENMKYEIANEFGVNLGASASSRDNGIVGGEITKRLVENGMSKSKTQANSNNKQKSKKRSKKSK